MAKGNYREYLKGDTVWLKKYLYVLRPILALQWMEQSSDPVPVHFNDLLDAVLPAGRTRQAIDRLLVLKQQGLEAKHGPAIPEINEFLEMGEGSNLCLTLLKFSLYSITCFLAVYYGELFFCSVKCDSKHDDFKVRRIVCLSR